MSILEACKSAWNEPNSLPKRILCFALWIFTIMAVFDSFAMNASAETGTISSTNHSFIDNFQMTPAGSAWTPDFTKIAVYTTAWNQVETIFIDASTANLAYATNGKSTTFTITGCGSGGGVASYSGSSKAIAWYFTNPSMVTCSPLVLSYTTNIFTDITATGGNQLERADLGVSAARPFAIADATNTHWWAGTCNSPLCNTHGAIKYNGVVDNTVSNNYTITYPVSGTFQTAIDKTGATVTTKVIIENATGTPVNYSVQGDPLGSYNTNSWTVINTYGQGIALNMTTSVGDFERVVVNTSGSTLPAPAAPTPTPPQAGATGAALSWNSNTYNVNDIGTLTGNVTVSPPLFGDIRVIISNTSGQRAFYVWDSSGTFPQTANYLYSFPSADIYTGKLISHSPFTGDVELANATTQVVAPISYIFAPDTVVTGTNITVTYKFSPVPSGGAIEDVIAPEFGGYGTYINSTLCPCNNASNTLNYVINGVGTHTLRLWDTTNFTVVASTIVHVNDVGGIVYGNITDNKLFLDASQYSIGDVINAQYQISSVNWSSFSYFKAALVSSGNVTMGNPVQLQQEAGTFQIGVTGGQFGIIQGGAANVTITAGNSAISAGTFLISAPVTILVDKGGYSISTNPVTICRNTPEVVKYTSPTGAGILQEQYMTPAGNTKFNNYSFSSNGTRTFVYNDGTLRDNGGIIYSVLSTTGEFQVNSIVKYQFSGCTPAGGTPPAGPTPPPTGTEQATSLITLITSNIFWALIITVGLMIFVAWRTKDGFPTATIGFLVGGIFTFLGWLPAWIFFSLFVIAALLVASSIVEKQIKNVTK